MTRTRTGSSWGRRPQVCRISPGARLPPPEPADHLHHLHHRHHRLHHRHRRRPPPHHPPHQRPPPPRLRPPPPPPAPPPNPPPQPPPPSPVRCRVPRVTGLTVGAAKSRIRRAHCSVARIRRQRSKRVGRVISQSPRPGTLRPRGAGVSLVVGRRS